MEPVSFKWLKIFLIISLLNITKQTDIACEIVQENQNGNEKALNNYIRCKGIFHEPEALRSVVANITNPIEIFELYNSSLDLLPEDIFRDAKYSIVKKILFSETNLSLFSLPENNISPFYSIENTLESFEVYDSSFPFAWNFSVLARLNHLHSIIIENSDVFTIEDMFYSLTNIRFIQMINCNIRLIHHKAFQKNINLSIFSLSNNLIRTVERSMFPQPAIFLWSLDLSYNKIDYLPKDMFEDMPYLKELKLDYNRLETIKGGVYKIVWNQLTQLWLDGNDMVCWALCPVLSENKREKKDRPLFFDSSICEKPPKKMVLLESFEC